MLVSVQDVSKAFLDDVVLSHVSLDIQEGARMGLLGANGAGKTTLLKLIAGDLAPDDGVIVRARGLEVGYLRQNDALQGERTLNEEARDAFAPQLALQQQMEACAAQLAATPGDAGLLAQYDKLQAAFEAAEGYRMEEKIDRVLSGLGFAGFDRDTRVQTLSGGEKMRFGFAKLLLRQPALLMLDEPTNHLDFSMLAWLEDYLESYKGAVLVVSHDRYFLDAVAKDICEVERHRLAVYHGGYSSFVVQKAERRKVAQRAYDKQQEEIAKLEDYVRRNIVRASTSNMAKSRQKTLDKMERLEKPPPEGKTIALQFDYDAEPFQSVMRCEDLGVRVGEGEFARQLYSGINLELLRGEKLALVGLNGVGKSTFLKAIQDKVPHNGHVHWGGNVRLGYFDQELAGLPMDETVLEAVHSQYPAKTEFEIRRALGRLLLEGETVYKKVSELSGAMRAKVAFAILQMRRANVLLLDEPTNHLDYRAKEVLEAALRSFSGTVLAVSHDRYFLRRVPTAILEMRPDGFHRYAGNFDDYKEQKKREAAPGGAPPSGSLVTGQAEAGEAGAGDKKPAGGKRSKAQRAQDAQRRTRIAQLEALIAQLEAEMDAANAALADPQNASDFEVLGKLSQELDGCNIAFEEAMEEWMALQE